MRTVVVFRRLCRAAALVGTLRRTDLANILPGSCPQLRHDVAMDVGEWGMPRGAIVS
jgi:hypothetical protein